MRPSVSIVIPAWNEGARITSTLSCLTELKRNESVFDEIVVVDDGSTDNTAEKAGKWADRVIRHQANRGKGAALEIGWKGAQGDIVVFLDADLEESAIHAAMLVQPVVDGLADMTVASFPRAQARGGFGLVKGLASRGIQSLCGFTATAPLSGQRAVRRELLADTRGLSGGFGIEVGLTIDAVKKGYRVMEVQVPFHHRETGRDLRGFIHRGKQFIAVGRTLYEKWRDPIC
jgi:glycosyltransferase involved in cell wall biosynthesis